MKTKYAIAFAVTFYFGMNTGVLIGRKLQTIYAEKKKAVVKKIWDDLDERGKTEELTMDDVAYALTETKLFLDLIDQ